MKYDELREQALANFEVLLDYWGIEYRKIDTYEYDFINPTRQDTNFGACRFNVDKNRGADFAGTSFSSRDYTSLAPGFSKEDFASSSAVEQTNWGFDIIGLCQRLHKSSSYNDAARLLKDHLRDISENVNLVVPAADAAARRQHEQNIKNQKLIHYANKTWGLCKTNLENTEGEVYFLSRGLTPREKNIRFHPKIINKELNRAVPTLLFKVQENPEGPLVAIHRIYLKDNGLGKADVANPKMALARIKGAGIWFGTPGEILYIVEGPENALTVRHFGIPFSVSTINSTNYGSLTLPNYVKTVVLVPENDAAGQAAYNKAVTAYTAQNKKVKLAKLPAIKLPTGKMLDINDTIKASSNGGRTR